MEQLSIMPNALAAAQTETHKLAAAMHAEQRRWQVILLLQSKHPIAEIVAATGYRPRTIRQIAQRYRDNGSSGLQDGRHRGLGAAPLLTSEAQQELHQLLQGPPPDGGRWTGPKVALWIATKTGKRVHRQRGWEYLRRLTQMDTDATTAIKIDAETSIP